MTPLEMITSPADQTSAAAGCDALAAGPVGDDHIVPPSATRTPATRPARSNSRDWAWVPVITVSSGLSMTGRTKDVHALIRRPPRTFRWARPTPKMDSPLQSSLRGIPYSAAASMKETVAGFGSWLRATGSGPPPPWKAFGPSSKSSDLRKNGKTSSYAQPAAPL